MATRKLITQKDLIQAKRQGFDEGFASGRSTGRGEGYTDGLREGESRILKKLKSKRSDVLLAALEQIARTADAAAHLGAAIAKESL